MERWFSPMPVLLFIAALMAAAGSSCGAVQAKGSSSFEDNFDIMWSEDHFKSSEDGEIWYLSLDKETGQLIVFHFSEREQKSEF